jgi:hypothetical protein
MIKHCCILFVFVFASAVAFAQRGKAFETWTTFAVEKKFSKYTLNVEEGWRVREFYLSRQTYTDVTLERKINSSLSVALGYRLTFKNSYVHYDDINNRFYLDVQVQHKFGNLSLSYRPRIQFSTYTVENDYGLFSQTYFRNKFKLGYKFSGNFSAGISDELFLYIVPNNTVLNESRLSIMGDYKLNDKFTISAGYMMRYYMQMADLLTIHIFALDCCYKF